MTSNTIVVFVNAQEAVISTIIMSYPARKEKRSFPSDLTTLILCKEHPYMSELVAFLSHRKLWRIEASAAVIPETW